MTKTRQWSVMTVVAVLVVFAAGWFLLVKPQNSHAADLRSQAADQQASNQRLLAQIASLQSEQKTLPQQQKVLQKFATQVPDNAAEPAILRQLSAAAAGSGVDLLTLTPGTPTAVTPAATAGTTSLTPTASTADQLMALPLSIGITGTYPNVESFFQSLEKLPRALQVGSWSLCPMPNANGSGAAAAPAAGGGNCSPPTVPNGKSEPTDAIGGTLSAIVYYAPPAAPVTGTSTTGGATLPSTTPSAAATAPAS